VLGGVLMVTGGVFVLIAVLTLTNAGYGARPTREFSQRRSYNMVKTDVFRAFPRFILQAGTGLIVVWAGLRLRKKSERAGAPVPPQADVRPDE
jgi:hypothetical protein